MTYRIHYNHNYWVNGSGWSNSETMESWEVEAESFEDLKENLYCDCDEAEDLNNTELEDLILLAEAKEGDTEIEVTATELDEYGNEGKKRVVFTLWLSDLVKEFWRYRNFIEKKGTQIVK